MPGNPLVRFDEARVGRTARCRPLSYSIETRRFPLLNFSHLLTLTIAAQKALCRPNATMFEPAAIAM